MFNKKNIKWTVYFFIFWYMKVVSTCEIVTRLFHIVNWFDKIHVLRNVQLFPGVNTLTHTIRHKVHCSVSVRNLLLKYLKIDSDLIIYDIKNKYLNNHCSAPRGFGVVMKPALLPRTLLGSCRRIPGRPHSLRPPGTCHSRRQGQVVAWTQGQCSWHQRDQSAKTEEHTLR